MTVKKLKSRGKATDRYYCIFTLNGEPVRIPLLESREQSLRLSRLIESACDMKRAGSALVLPELLAAVKAEPALGRRLARYGLVPASAISAADAFVDEWVAALKARATPAYADLCGARVRKLLAGLAMSDITRARVEQAMSDLRLDKDGVGPRTANFYGSGASQYCGWLVETGRLSANPLAGLRYASVGSDIRHGRRALSDDELEWLLRETATRSPERALVYRLAAETGLRCNEIRELTARRFTTAAPFTVTVTAESAKNGREAVLPLRPATAAMVLAHIGCKLPDTRCFKMPERTRVSSVLRKDLAAARAAYLVRQAQLGQPADDRFLVYEVDGKFADFHALRHTFCTRLGRAGVAPKTMQMLARHSDIQLTLVTYSHSTTDELAAAINALPAIAG